MLSTRSHDYDSRSRSSYGSSRRSRKSKKEEVTDFQMFIIDGDTGDYITPEKVEARGAPKRFVLIIRRNQKYKIKVKIAAGAWEQEVNPYQWFHVELLIDGQHITRRFLRKPLDGDTEFTFDCDPAGRAFIFDTRHDGTQGPVDHVPDSDEVGQIVIRFRRARSVNFMDRPRKRPRRNHDYHRQSQFMIREAEKKNMDIETKEKKSTMRTKFGPATREERRGGGRGGGSGPPAKVVDEDDIVAECSTMYDSAEAFELRNWINPLLNEKFRKYFKDRDFEREKELYDINQRKRAAVCDLTFDEDDPQWDVGPGNVKMEARRTPVFQQPQRVINLT